MRRLLTLSGSILLGASLAAAATTSRLTGTVVDHENQPLPGVTVTLSSEVLIGGPQVQVTDAAGAFQFPLLPPGRYLVRTELSGFLPAEVEARVELDRVAKVQVQTALAQFQDRVEVSAEAPVVDVTQVASGSNFDEEFLQGAAVGMTGRNFLSVMTDVAGVTADKRSNPDINPRTDPRSNPKVMGSRPADNVYLIDGLNTTDAYYGTFASTVNFDAIREVSVRTSGYEAEFGQALGAVVNLVTKSGGNSFSGSLDLRYRDERLSEAGEHYDPDLMANSLRHLTATLGGPIARDRLWFFVALEDKLAEETPSGSPVTRELQSTPWSVKLTWQASAAIRATLKAANDAERIGNYNAGRFMTAEAGQKWELGGDLYQLELNAVPSEDWVLSLQVGVNRPTIDISPMSGDLETPARFDVDVNAHNLAFANYGPVEWNDCFSDQARASATRFVDDLAGAHQLKAGVELRRLETSYVQFQPGGQAYELLELYDPVTNPDATGRLDLDGDGYTDKFMYRYNTPWDVPVSEVGEQWSAYLQDSWQPLPPLTVKPGVRYDRATYDNTQGRQVADLEVWQPRLGVAWDLLGTGKSVLRASWGRFMHPSTNNLPSYITGRGSATLTYTGYEYLCAIPGTNLCDRQWLAAHRAIDGQEVVTVDAAGHEHYWYLTQRTLGAPWESVDSLGAGHLQAPEMESLSLAFEQQLGRSSSVSVEYVDKRSRHLFDDTCNGNAWVWDSTLPPGSFDDPSTWTHVPADPAHPRPGERDDCTGYVVANLPGLRRDYDALIVALDLRTESLRVMGNYAYSRSRGNSKGDVEGIYATEEYDRFPLDFYNLYGYMDDDARHRVKLDGYWLLPYDFTLSVDYRWESASALNVTAKCGGKDDPTGGGYDPRWGNFCLNGGSMSSDMYILPRGSGRTPGTYDQLDLALSKGFPIHDVRLEVSVAVINVIGDEEPVDFWTRVFDPTYHWGQAMEWSRPRRYEIGLRLEF